MKSIPDLPAVTLCAIDCVNPVPAFRALDLCGLQCRFGDVLFLSDTANQYQLAGCRMEVIPRIGSVAEYSRFVLKELSRHIRTGHVLLVAKRFSLILVPFGMPIFMRALMRSFSIL